MQDDQTNKNKDIQISRIETQEEGYVVLPYNEGQFKDFIKGLLGTPQNIEKKISGSFSINIDDIRNLHQLITQRVSQQNSGFLIQFTSKIMFSNNSSIEMNSIEELLTYNETRPITSHIILLTWNFMIQFQDKKVPEKQRISITIYAQNTIRNPSYPYNRFGYGYFNILIEHTARTWGLDIESLLSNHIQTLLIEEPQLKKFLRKYHGWVGLAAGLTFFASTIAGGVISASIFSENRIREVNIFLENNKQITNESLNKKMEYIINFIAGGTWSKYYFALIIFLILATIASIIFAVWTSEAANNKEPSFLLLTKQSHKNKETKLKELRREWRLFVYSIIVNILIGIISNIIFTWINST